MSDNLSDAKRRLIERRLRGQSAGKATLSTIPQRSPGVSVPLSPAQHGIWLLHRVDPTSAAYNLNAAFEVEGEVDLGILERSLNFVAQRHEILLTHFVPSPSGVLQVVDRQARLVVDRQPCGDSEVVEYARSLARWTFDLESGPLLRLTLIDGEGHRQLLLLTSHHVILDEWSLGVLWRELAAAYEAFSIGNRPVLDDLPIQFADYALWQHQRLTGDLAQEQLGFWRRRLSEPLPVAELPTDRPRSAATSDRGGYVADSIDPETTRRLQELAAGESATLSMVLLLGWNLLLQRYTGLDDLLVGTPLADRQRPETSSILGYFLNTVVVRTDLGGSPAVREALQRIRSAMLEIFDHGDVPFDRIVRELNPPRPAGAHPYFQTMFVFQRQQDALETLFLPTATLEPLTIDAASAKFDLTLFAQEKDEGLVISLEYRRDLFERDTVERLLGHYSTLLDSVASGWDQCIDNLEILTPVEQRLVLHTWQGRDLAVEQQPLAHEVLVARAIEKSGNPAVCGRRGPAMTYGELQRVATAVATRLEATGLLPGELVALQLERSPAAIAAIFGILEAGGAYLPVDPQYPAERRRFMVQQAGARLAVCDEDAREELAAMGIQTITVPELSAAIAPPVFPAAKVDPVALAYVIYTSGSTGRPKAVAVSHANLRASIAARLDYYPEAPERYLLIPSFSFDSSVAGIFWTLSTGGTLVLPTETEVRDPEALLSLIENRQVTHLLGIPTLYRRLLETAGSSSLSSLQTVIVAGEACPPDLVAAHRKALPEVPLFNEYGPTEATVWATVHRCSEPDTRGIVPIGRPIANTRAYLLDARHRPVPAMVTGRIHIAGPGVTQGYLGDPDLTREKFFAVDGLGCGTPVRVYDTGDLGRWRTDGALEFLGRRDGQVKVSGYRIELAEVEAALRTHPAVSEAAATVVTDAGDSERQRLVAWYCPREPHAPPLDTSMLRRHLARVLPSHMLPTSLVAVQELPRQPNGKLDRQALATAGLAVQVGTRDTEPASRTEAQLMRIWLELLDDPSIERHSNFFEHGGHSLLIPALIERVRHDFGIDLPLGTIFEAPTVAELALVLDAGDAQSSWRSLVSIRSRGSKPPLYVVHGLAGEISYFYNLARYLPDDRPVFGLQAPARPFTSMVPMAEHYLQEIRHTQARGPYFLVGYCLGGCIAYEMARQLVAAGETVDLLVLINSVPPRHLLDESAPLATILARRLKRFTSKGPRQMLESLASVEAVKRHLKSGVRGDRESADETLDDLLERMHPAYREATICHYQALRDYEPLPYPGDAWLFRGSDLYVGADYAWRQIVQGRLEVESISGHHQYVLKEPHVQGAAKKISRLLASRERQSGDWRS